MSDSLAVLRLRTSGTRAAAEALLLGAVPTAPDRSILIVRRLSLVDDDPVSPRRRMDQLRRTAARPRPGQGMLDPGSAEAVLFEDAAQLLACLTADLVTGVAVGRWYWRPRLARGSGRALVRAWIDEARWLPSALRLLEQAAPTLVPAAIESVTPAERRAVIAALTQAGVRVPVVLLERQPDAKPAALTWAPAPVPAPGRPPPPRSGRHGSAVDRPSTPVIEGPSTPESGPERASSRPSPSDPPEPAAVPDVGSSEPQRLGEQIPGTAGTVPPDVPVVRAGVRRDELASGVGIRPRAGAPPEPRQPARASRSVPVARTLPTPTTPALDPVVPPVSQPPARSSATMLSGRPPRGESSAARSLEAAALIVEVRLAGVLFLLPLMLRLARLARPDGPEPGWTQLEGFARHVLPRRTPLRRRRADPLWGVLRALAAEGQEAPSGAAVRAAWWPDAVELLAHDGVGPRQLMVPGRIAVTRTHVDVLLTLDQIDLRVRRAGLDQDPGWVPSLRRIVSFHFL